MEPPANDREPAVEKGDGPSSETLDEDRVAVLRTVAEIRHPHLIVMKRTSRSLVEFEPETSGAVPLSDFIDPATGTCTFALRVQVRLLLDALSGLAALHHAKRDGRELSFVHGEIAPHNIFIGRDGLAKLVPLVESHWTVPPLPSTRSLGYVAPERLLGDVFDQRADVFSVGVLLWEAIAGRRLFRNMRMDAIVTQLIANALPRPEAPPDAPWAGPLVDVAVQALSVDPADRWPHVGLLGAEIETIAEGCLAGSDEIARLVRRREKGEPVAPEAEVVPSSTSGSVLPSSTPAANDSAAMVVRARTSEPPSSVGLVPWYGPRSARNPEEDDEPPGSRSDRPRRRTQSYRPDRDHSRNKWAWIVAGVAVGMLAVAVRGLFDRGPSTIAATPLTATYTPIVVPAAPSPAPPAQSAEIASAPARLPASDANDAGRAAPREIGAARSPVAPAAVNRPSSQARAAPKPAPEPVPSASSPPPEREPEPPPQVKPKEDLFGI